ncbi:MAG: aminotransferase class I/II-fold pyridoxal phosphate-dependent enzyme [Ornithinimicrobium sp.]
MSQFPQQLIRPDLRSFAGYSSARTSFEGPPARIWLNANEAAEANHVDPEGQARRYPAPQPAALRDALASYLGAPSGNILLARGSDETIDVLVRGLCPPGGNNGIVICSPTFGMYAVAAALLGVPVHDVPQVDTGRSFAHDLGRVAQTARDTNARIVFLASPDNPTGASIDLASIAALASELSSQALVVIDEAYAEFAGNAAARPRGADRNHRAVGSGGEDRYHGAVGSAGDGGSAIALIDEHPNLAVLRTMSKAHALAGARVGALVAHPELIAVLRRVQAPYPMPTPVVDLALAALSPEAIENTRQRVAATIALRPRLHEVVADHPGVRSVYCGEGNFVLARCHAAASDLDTASNTDPNAESDGADSVLADAARSGIAVRDMRHLPGLADAVRVSVGTAEEIEALALAISLSATQSSDGQPPTSTPGSTFEPTPASHDEGRS